MVGYHIKKCIYVCIYVSIYIYTHTHTHTYTHTYIYIHTYHHGTKLKQNKISTCISPILSLLVYLSTSVKMDLVVIYLKHWSECLSRRRMREVVGNEGVLYLREWKYCQYFESVTQFYKLSGRREGGKKRGRKGGRNGREEIPL